MANKGLVVVLATTIKNGVHCFLVKDKGLDLEWHVIVQCLIVLSLTRLLSHDLSLCSTSALLRA